MAKVLDNRELHVDDLCETLDKFERAYRSGRYHENRDETRANRLAKRLRHAPMVLGGVLTPGFHAAQKIALAEWLANQKGKSRC